MAVAVITGAASGIGAGLAREAVRRGMQVVLADVERAALEALAGELGECALAVQTDVTDPAALDHLAERSFAAFGRVDLLFNNAGVMVTGRSWEIAPAAWGRSLAVNIGGVINGLRAFVPRLLESGKPARIVNTASVGGFLPSPLMAPYSATKFAVVALTEALAGELAMMGSQIAVSLLAPGPVRSAIFREAPGKDAEAFHEAMTGMLAEHGMEAEPFAALVFDAIDRGDYWIVPQPDALDPGLAARHAAIMGRTPPRFFTTEKAGQ